MAIDRRKIILGIVLLLFIGGGICIGKLSKENKQLKTEIQNLREDPQKATREETQRVIALVSKLVILPAGEEPVIATVTDKEKLKDQPLFAKAENGDKILVYAKAQKAYIYDPRKNVIVDVVFVGTDINNPLRLALVNGTKTTGITAELEKRIKDKGVTGIIVVSRTAAETKNYQKTLVIDKSGKWKVQAGELAGLLGGETATQSAETWPTGADLMVIVGADFK